MPRIDPQQLLTCLQVLLSPAGGILSRNEVQRLANLMTKFSKKLVSKCIYVLILKNTERQLLGAFMSEGGWNLIHLWLQDAHVNKNWALVSEVLELLLITPVDVDRLKMNNLPKLVKGLSKREDLPGIQQLATSLVDQWLTIVKDVTKQESQQQQMLAQLAQQQLHVGDAAAVATAAPVSEEEPIQMETPAVGDDDEAEPMEIDETISNDANTIVSENGVDTSLRVKFVRDGKRVISRIVAVRTDGAALEEATQEDDASAEVGEEDSVDGTTADATAATSGRTDESGEGTDKENSDKKQKSVPKKSSSNSSSKSSSSSSSSSRDKDRSRDKSKSSSSSSRSSSSKSSSRDKDRRDRDKDRHRHNGSSSSSSSSSSKHRSSSSKSSSSSKDKKDKDAKEAKDKQAERDKDTLAKIQPQTLQKLGRIPRREDGKDGKKDDKKDVKKPSFSVEVRKKDEEKPKTVKVYNSKMRSTGLMEEAKPPPPRSATKKTAPPPTLPATIPTKRPSPIRDTIPPPEKKSRLIDPEKGIKLIPPKPKPAVLQESDIFMDALTASATTKKEPKKRKRRTSTSKDTSPPPSPSKQPTPSSPTALKNITPANFYQDTLADNDDDAKEKDDEDKDDKESENKDEDNKSADTPAEPDEDDTTMEETTKTDANGLKGVLSYAKRKGPKRSIRWRPDAELVEVQYFELDETERVNVMKPFMDMQRMEMSNERDALRHRKLPSEDTMEAALTWRPLIEVECAPPATELGSKSLEKNIQFAREKTVLQAIYFNNRVPDTPAEPDHEIQPMVNAIVIPLHDPDQPEQEAPIQPWPDPKGSPPHISSTPPMFNNIQPPAFMQAPGGFPPNGLPQFAPAFAPPGMMNRPPGDWNLMPPNGIPPKFPPPELMQQIPPMFDNFGGANGPNHGGPPGPGGPPMGPPGGGGGPDGFVPPFANGPNPMPQMFPPNNFNNNMRGRGGFRRGGPNNGPWLRMGAPPPNQGGGGGWNNAGRGRGFCNSFKQKGFCRNGNNCPYIH